MRETLPIALELMFGHEGGYTNHKGDKGNYLNGVLVGTKFGITGKTLAAHRGVASVTAEQVKAMTREEATEIYRRSYWTQSGGDLLPKGLDYAAFDFGVNSGPATAVRRLQKVLGVREDGVVGEQTVAAVKAYPGGIAKLIHAYCDERMAYLRSLTNAKTGFPVNGRGWTIRVTGKDPKGQWADQLGVVGNAVRLATLSADTPQIRQFSAGVGCIIWTGITYGFASSDVVSTWIAIYPLFAFGELVNINRAARDQGEIRNGTAG